MLANLDLPAIGQAIVTIGAVAGGAWAGMEIRRKKRAEARADIAERRTEEIVADANGTVYNLLVDRLKALELEVLGVRQDLSNERELRRKLENDLARLLTWIRLQNLVPPEF